MTRARLKAGPSHPLDVLITIATVCVGGFFLLVLASQLPWRWLTGRKEEVLEEEEEEGEDNSEGEEEGEGAEDHVKSD